MIVGMEMKKLFCHPMLWCIAFIFLAFNILLIRTYVGENKKELDTIHQSTVAGELDSSYINEVQKLYDKLDMNEIKILKENLTNSRLSGSYKKFVDRCYEKLNTRVSQIKKDGEAEQITYPGQIYRLHNILYNKIFKTLLLEMALIMALSILFLMDYERIHKTEDIVYSTRQGRNGQRVKFISGLLTGEIFGIVLMAVTLCIYFLQVPYKGLWNVSISSAMTAEPRGVLLYPFITYYKMTFLQYLLASIAMGILLVGVVGFLTGTIQIFVRNSYLAVILVILLLMAFLALGQMNTQSWFDLFLSFNTAISWIHCGAWFMENELYGSFPIYEIISIMVQGIIIGILWILGCKKFKNKDLL